MRSLVWEIKGEGIMKNEKMKNKNNSHPEQKQQFLP